MKTLVALFLALFWMSLASAETYVISPPESLDSCNEEFENLANSLQPGDELVLNDGVYSQGCARRISINGTPENPIVIRAAEGASPLMTRPSSTSATNNNIELSGSHFTIRGLRFQYGSSGVRFMGSNNITFENNKIYDTLNNALTMNSGSTDSHVLRNNEIYNTGLASGSTEGEGIYIGQHSGGSPGTNHLIENNYIHDLRSTSSGGNDGIEIKFGSGGNTVRGNVIHDTTIGQEFPCIFVYGHGDQPNIIEKNLLYNCGEAILVTADAIIRNNVILDSSINGIHLRVQNPAPNIQNVTIVNNTVYGSHPVCARLLIGSAPNVVVANNAFYCENTTAISGNGFANAVISNNVVRGSVSGLTIDNMRVIQGTPAVDNFLDPSMQDFRLLSDAFLIDAGTSVTGMGAEDFAGNARVSGVSVDVGGHEYDFSDSVDEPTLVFTSPVTVEINTSATLQWTTTGADTCTASGGWSGNRPASGTEQTAPLTADTTFNLSCTGQGGSVSESVQVMVTAAPPDEPTLVFTGSLTVELNTPATLQWTTTGADTCTASGGWSGNRPASGTEQTAPLTTDTTFTLSCTGAGGTVTDMILINVTAPPPVAPTLSFTGPSSVPQNMSASLQWSSTNTSTCTAAGGWTGSRLTSGTEQTTPLLADTTFTLTCTGPGGTVTQSVDVMVIAPPADSDQDGLPDSWEQQYFGTLDQDGQGDGDSDALNNLDEHTAGTDPTKSDTDGEGLPDGEEIALGTNPLVSDSDGDGSSDFVEVSNGSDPLDSTNRPPETLPPQAPDPVPNSGGGALHPGLLIVLLLLGIRQRFRKPPTGLR